MTQEKKLRWGVLATGAIAADVVPGLLRSERNVARAVGSRDAAKAEAFRAKYDLDSAHSSYEDLIADTEIDCLYVCVPNSMHFEWTKAALQAGKHVLCEKPLTPTASQAAALFDVARKHNVCLAEAFMYRHHPKTASLKTIIDSGRIGDVHTIRSSFNYRAVDPSGDVRFSSDLAGGALLDVGSYCVSVSNFLAGEEPSDVVGRETLWSSGVDTEFFGIITYPSGIHALFDCSMQAALSLGVSVLGTQGEAMLRMPWYAHKAPHTVEILLTDGTSEEEEVIGENAYFLETEDFARYVLGEAPPVVSEYETVRNISTMERLKESARA